MLIYLIIKILFQTGQLQNVEYEQQEIETLAEDAELTFDPEMNDASSTIFNLYQKVWASIDNEEIWPGVITDMDDEDKVTVYIFGKMENIDLSYDRIQPFDTYRIVLPNSKPSIEYETALMEAYLHAD